MVLQAMDVAVHHSGSCTVCFSNGLYLMPEAALTPPRRTLAGGLAGGQADGLVILTKPEPSPFVELGAASCFSFLRGASDAVDLVSRAREHGYDALGIADANSMAGIVRLHSEAKHAGLRPVIGCRIELANGPAVLAYPKNRRRLWPDLHLAVEG